MSDQKYASLKAEVPLPPAVYALSDLFAQNGASLFAVGGVIRDFLYSQHHGGTFSPKDVDVATEATPPQVLRILNSQAGKNLGIRAFPKGEAFGVVSAVMNGEEYEIATFREEWYDPETGDGRRPDEVLYSTPAEDAKRRDLTFNALFYDIQSREIRDYNLDEKGLGQGFDDIRNLVARPVGNARDRFREDKLRIPRLVRFFSRFNPGEIRAHLDRNTLDAIEEFKGLIGVSPERIVNEFVAGLQKAKNPVSYLKNYESVGLLPAVFPGLRVDMADVDRVGETRNIKAVLAWLLKSNGDVRQKLNDLKYPNDISDSVAFLLKLYSFDVSRVAQLLKKRDLHKQLKDDKIAEHCRKTVHQDVMDFAAMSGQVREMWYFLNYQPVVKSQDFMHLEKSTISQAMSAAESDAYQKSFQ